MKDDNWNDCIENGSSISVSPNKGKVNSLIDTAKGRIEYLDGDKVNEKNANYIFEGYYSSALELMHSILLLKGYKVSNHICLGYFFRDVLKEEKLFRLFDDCRYKRNSLVYYGRKMDFETAKLAIKNCKELIKELEGKLEI
ncbi:MAG: hypothetical protein ABIJ18_03610 [archaeon]